MTNQYDIVQHAKYCYNNYPTIVNLIPKQKNSYSLSLENYARIDNKLADAQLAIGQSSNMAQLCLTYTYNFDDGKYNDYVCILAVLAQAAIDNCKRTFDVNISREIDRIGKDMDIAKNGLPLFWQITKKDKRKARTEEERRERDKQNRERIREKINEELVCPMNYLYNMNLEKFRHNSPTLPMNDFFINHKPELHHRKCRKVEEFIEKYSLELYKNRSTNDFLDWKDDDVNLLLRSDFDDLINDIKKIYVSRNYIGLFSWLINRAFLIGSGAKGKSDTMVSQLRRNKPILMSTLYNINKDAFMACFVANNPKDTSDKARFH